jgi:hypothetical protein
MHPRQLESGNNMFLVVSLIVGGIAVLMAIGVFAYAHLLSTESAEKASELETAQSSVSEDTVESFLRLRNRLTESERILDQHILLSQFFDRLESLSLANVRFTSLVLTVDESQSAAVKMTGTAKTFNALAAQSASFATDPLIKQAIFSDISVDKNGLVTFSVSATLDPRMIVIPSTVPSGWSGAASAAAADATTTDDTATTTP